MGVGIVETGGQLSLLDGEEELLDPGLTEVRQTELGSSVGLAVDLEGPGHRHSRVLDVDGDAEVVSLGEDEEQFRAVLHTEMVIWIKCCAAVYLGDSGPGYVPPGHHISRAVLHSGHYRGPGKVGGSQHI